jgi:class 3 adenylate cyclase/tetratricopeptide (TPR) repeat protein
MVCSNCGTQNAPGKKFCTQCGTSLALACASCGAALDPTEKFCGECGTRVADGPARAAAPTVTPARPAESAPATERRLVSVLFADLVGFTTISEARDSEEVRDLLSRYFDTCRTVITRYGGVVEKFIGDAVMAVWGTPVAKEDDPERAVRAALDLIAAVEALGADVGVTELRARAGVLTGEATVNLDAAGEGMVAGDLVNTASRVQSAAEPGSVYVGESTRRATEAAIAYGDAGTHELKGKAEPVHLWSALRVTAGRGGLMKSEGLEPPFVGRDRELKLVKELFHGCVDEGRATLVQVTGIAGIGKSRLAWEFFKYMDGLEKVYYWHRGRCLAYGEGVTYWALAEMVRGRADILEGEDRASATVKLHEAVEQYVSDPEERRFVEPRLAHLLGLAERTAPDKNDLFAGWRLFFERLTDQLPVLMVFEDLQWADPSLLEFLDYLLEWSRSFSIFVLTLARPGTDGAGLTARRHATSIYLDPLPPAAMERLLTGFVPGLSAEMTGKILERAEGVPLYAVETVRMLLDRGLLVEDGPVYRVAGEVDLLDVPETLQALIAARLDGLSVEERRLVQDASVLGKTFTRGAAAALTGLGERELEPLLASLVAKEVLYVQADPRSPERGQYGFLQDIVRSVAYETVSKKDRKDKHLRVAAYLEQAWGEDEEEIVEVVAAHLLDAYRLAPDADDASGIGERARRMLVRAAERSASLAAAEEAMTYFQQAAELTESTLGRAELMERTGQMAFALGRVEPATKGYEDAISLFEEAGQGHQAARVQARLAEVEFVKGHLDQALDRMRTAFDVLRGEEPDPDLAVVAAQLGRFLALAGRHEEAIPALEEALELAEHLDLPEVYSGALSSRAIGLMTRDRLKEATALVEHALAVALERGTPQTAIRAYNNLGVVLEMQDRYADALEQGRSALALARRAGDRPRELAWLTGSIIEMVMLGLWEEAEASAQEALAVPEIESLVWARQPLLDFVPMLIAQGRREEAGNLVFHEEASETSQDSRLGNALARARILREDGELAEAVSEVERALGIGVGIGPTHSSVKRLIVEGVEAALEMGDVGKAEELLGIVQRARPGQVTPFLRAHAARQSARVAALRGETDSVEPGFLAAERGFFEMAAPFELALTQVDHAEWLASVGRQGEADDLLGQARGVFQRLRATPWIERVDRASRSAVRSHPTADVP